VIRCENAAATAILDAAGICHTPEVTQRLAVVGFGGTIAMAATPDGLRVPHSQQGVFDLIAGLAAPDWTTSYVDVSTADSADGTPGSWELLVSAVRAAAVGADAVLVTHGTDTLAWSAAALAVCGPWQIPIVATAAMQPIGASGSDARRNIAGSLVTAADAPAGAWVVFDSLLGAPEDCVVIQAGFARKVGLGPGCFIDVTGWPWGRIEEGKLVQYGAVRQSPDGVEAQFPRRVLNIECSPGTDWDWLVDAVLANPPEAMVIQTYVSLAAPPGCLTLTEIATRGGVPVVAVPPSPISSIDYPSTRVLQAAGALVRPDLTIELATCLLSARSLG
jgi:L-asparaginase/Glu-tRNA(Gln) amidotransferase subunit D